MNIRLTLMDRAVLTRDGVPVRLEPRFMAVLIRLALDLGRNVRADELSGQVLMPGSGALTPWPKETKDELRRRRVHVYKCVSAIRSALDPERPGEESALLLTDPGKNPGYRLELPPDSIDLLEFEHLVAGSQSAPPVRAVTQLRHALNLWRGRPLVDVEHHEWARPRIQSVARTHDEARRRLLDLYETFDRLDPAIEIGRTLSADHPDDTVLSDRLARLARRRRTDSPEIRHATGTAGGTVTVHLGDLFDQDDAHLVVGFTDTFESNTADDFLVSSTSLQGQLLHRLYDGDHRLLDRELRKALRDAPRTVESRATKRYGKLRRHPIGTVAVLSQGGRRIFGLAYSRVDKQGVYAQSSLPRLRTALDRLWRSVRTHGQYRPVAIAVVGSGLARIDGLDRVGLIELIVRSFMEHQTRSRLTDELRIVVHPKDATTMNMEAVDAAILTVVGEALTENYER